MPNEFGSYRSKRAQARSLSGATGFSLFSTLAWQFIAWRTALPNYIINLQHGASSFSRVNSWPGRTAIYRRARYDLSLSVTRQQLTQRLEELKAEVEAVVNKAGAVSPQLVAALQAFSDKALAERMAESMAPLAILGGKSVADVLAQLLKGTILEKVLGDIGDEEA